MLTGTAKPTPSLPRLLANNGGVDTDEPAFGIHQRAAGIAGVDGRVGLNEILILVETRQAAAAQRADNAHRHGLADTEGIADGEHNVADFQLVAVAQRDGGQVFRVNLQHGHVRRRVGADDFGGEFFAVAIADGDLDFVRAVHDMVGRQNVTVR